MRCDSFVVCTFCLGEFGLFVKRGQISLNLAYYSCLNSLKIFCKLLYKFAGLLSLLKIFKGHDYFKHRAKRY